MARGVARGAAQAHADSFQSGKTNSQQQQQDNGFLNILLGEHAQIMEQLNEKAPSDPAVYHASASTSTKAAKNKTDEVAESKAKTPPTSSLQRRLAQMKAPATPTKGQGKGVSKASTTPPPTAIATTLSPASPSSNHRHRTQWSPSSPIDDDEEEDEDEEEEALSTTILPYYEACDEVVNRLGIGSRPSRHSSTTTHTSPDTSPARSTGSISTTNASPARRIGASAATYPRDGDGDGEEDVDSPVKLARIMASGAIPYHPATSSSASTGTLTESPVKLARIMGCGAIPTIPEENGEEAEE